MIKGAIFDVDGTLLDTMGTWHNCGVRYLAKFGIQADPGLGDILFTHTSETGARYLIDTYHLDMDADEVAEGLTKEMEDFYYNEADFKPGAKDLLDRLQDEGVPMTVATSTDRYCIEAAFRRLGITDYFRGILTCMEVGATKSSPDIFYRAAELLGVADRDCWVFEDGLYAVKTAAKAGFRTVAVYDEISKNDWGELTELADESVATLEDLDERSL